MYSVIKTASVCGMEIRPVEVEADVSEGMPSFDMVGFLSSEVKEAKERVRTAMKNSGFALPPKRIMVNLLPVNLRKVGNIYDLPVAVAIMLSMGLIQCGEIERYLIIGEVGLDGKVHPAEGVLPIVCRALEEGFERVIIPAGNLREASCVEGIGITAVGSLTETVAYFGMNEEDRREFDEERLKAAGAFDANGGLSPQTEVYGNAPDFSDIRGQKAVKRACEVAVSGMHNFLMVGPPGAGKTMIASRIPGIMPEPDFQERMEITKTYSIAGELRAGEGLKESRPFRAPHHTVSLQGMVGGGAIPRPGEVTLANGGVLFLDELPEFAKSVLETLRQPLEDGKVTIVRASGRYEYPADFMLVAAMNPCACGYYPDRNRCSCSFTQVSRYLGKISRPLLDRIDVSIEAPRISYDELSKKSSSEETSQMIRERVKEVHLIQKDRYKRLGISFNSQLKGKQVEKYCVLNESMKDYMAMVFDRMNLTARGYHKILKVARTIADMRRSDAIEEEDIMEALMYKGIDEKYFSEVVR